MKTDLLVSLVDAHARGDSGRFVAAVEELAAKERQQGHDAVAHRLLDALGANAVEEYAAHPLKGEIKPTQGEAGAFWSLNNQTARLDDLTLSEPLAAALQAVRDDLLFRGRLASMGFPEATRAIFHGPPGTGKTHAVMAIAASVQRPLLTVHLDALVSSYLGETAQRLGEVFRVAQERGAILFVDELDSIGRERDDARENGELKRVVIALLQLMDRTRERVPVLAATNHADSLDVAIWRRFTDQILFDLPAQPARMEILARLLQQHGPGISSEALQSLAEQTGGYSGADLTTMVRHAARSAIRRGQSRIEEADLMEAKGFGRKAGGHSGGSHHSRKNNKERDQRIRELRAHGMTQMNIGRREGLSQSRVSKILSVKP